MFAPLALAGPTLPSTWLAGAELCEASRAARLSACDVRSNEKVPKLRNAMVAPKPPQASDETSGESKCASSAMHSPAPIAIDVGPMRIAGDAMKSACSATNAFVAAVGIVQLCHSAPRLQ